MPSPASPLTDPAQAEARAQASRPESRWPDQPPSLDSRQSGGPLSAFDPDQGRRRAAAERMAGRLLFCQPGASLKLVLAVQVLVAGAVWSHAPGWSAVWLLWPAPALAALGATLVWMAVLCGWRERLVRQAPRQVALFAGAWGGASALLGWALLLPFGLAAPSAWAAVVAAVCGSAVATAAWHWAGLRQAALHPVQHDARLAELQSRIRPHFLFNALNAAVALVQVDPPRAEQVLEDLSALFRAALAEVGVSVTLDEELDLAQRYLAIEQIRFARRLSLSWDLDPAASQARVPPLVLQPLVENAVRHGIEPAALGGTVWVSTRVVRGMVEVEVSNTLPDAPGNPGTGIALANVRERLRLLHDLAADLQTWVADGKHHARITVPLDG
jgi:two-component system sensor histidine kinase AlgZ